MREEEFKSRAKLYGVGDVRCGNIGLVDQAEGAAIAGLAGDGEGAESVKQERVGEMREWNFGGGVMLANCGECIASGNLRGMGKGRGTDSIARWTGRVSDGV